MGEYRELIVGYDGGERGGDALALGEMLRRSLDLPLREVRFVAKRADEAEVEQLPTGAEVSVIESPSSVKGFERLAGGRSDALIVLGSTHRAGLQRVFPGSVAERLLQHGRCAVAIAPRGYANRDEEPDELRVIAVGFTDRPESRAALEAATYLGLRAGATLRVVAVGPSRDREQLLADPRQGAGEGLNDALAAAVRELPAEVRALPIFLRGNPAPLLWDKAEEGVDLLVIGSGGEGPLLRAWLSDPATVLMRSAPCPVLLTPG